MTKAPRFMKIKLFLVSIAVCLMITSCSEDSPNPKNEPVGDEWIDSVFSEVLQERGYIKNATTVTPSEVANLENVDVSGNLDAEGKITSVRGLKYFSNLKEFNCKYNQLTELDVSNNTHLTLLNCGYNYLTELNVSKNIQLTDLACHHNILSDLDFSENAQLTNLDCNYNKLTKLDISKNTKLKVLFCENNWLPKLDISKNTQLTNLYCSMNPGVYGVFVVTAWFDNNSIPSWDFTYESWTFNHSRIKIEYKKAS